jgi:hypothetical protein
MGLDNETDEIYLEGGEPVRNGNQVVNVFFLPEYYSSTKNAGRSDLGVPRRKLGSINDTDDLLGTVKKFATVPGAYFAECRLGRDVVDSRVFELKARQQSAEVDAPQTIPLYAQQPQSGEARLDRLERLITSAIRPQRTLGARASVRRSNRGQERGQDSGVSKDDLYRMLLDRDREYNREARERERTLYEQMLERSRETERESNSEEGGERSALMLLLEDETIREKAVSSLSRLIDPESMPQKHWAVELGEMAFNNSEKLPMIVSAGAGLIGSVVGMFKGTPKPPAMPPPPAQYVPPQPQPAPPVQTAQSAVAPPTFEQEVDSTFDFILQECRDNAPVRKASRSVVWLLDTFPEQTKGVASLLELPGSQLCQMLATQLPAPEAIRILNLPHAPAWFDSLKAAIAKRRQKNADIPASDNGHHVAPPVVSNNGSNAASATIQAS